MFHKGCVWWGIRTALHFVKLLKSPSIPMSSHSICQLASLLSLPKYSANSWAIFRLRGFFFVILLPLGNEVDEGSSDCQCQQEDDSGNNRKKIIYYLVDKAVAQKELVQTSELVRPNISANCYECDPSLYKRDKDRNCAIGHSSSNSMRASSWILFN